MYAGAFGTLHMQLEKVGTWVGQEDLYKSQITQKCFIALETPSLDKLVWTPQDSDRAPQLNIFSCQGPQPSCREWAAIGKAGLS